MNKGYTLTEILTAATVLGIIVLGIATFLGQGARFFLITSARIDLQRSARTNLNIMMKKIREAKSTSIIIDKLHNAPPCSRIIFTTVKNEQLSYFQEGTKLYFSDLIKRTTKEMSTDLRYITFGYPRTDDDKIIHVSLCFEKYAGKPAAKIFHMSVEKIKIMN